MNSLPEFKVDTIGRQLFFSTARIIGTSSSDPQYYSEGTGFFYDASHTPGVTSPVLVTARHVVEGADELVVRLLLRNQAGNPDLGRYEDMTVGGGASHFFNHPDPSVDVAVMPLGAPLLMTALAGKPVAAQHIASSLCPGPADLEAIDAIEEVLFIGYPDTLYDSTNQTPIARRGITATPIQLDWHGHPQFLIDATVFPGSSGSPVVMIRPPARVTPTGYAITSRPPRPFFLGVLTPVYETPAEVEPHDGRRTRDSVQLPLGLGVVAKWSAVEETLDALFASQGATRTPTVPSQITVTSETSPKAATEQ